jgi:ubiquinol-cytochrome c reductase cytochrome b subunit
MNWIKGPWRWLDDRTGIGAVVGRLARHPVPPGVTTLRSGWWYVFGIATLTAFVVQLVTGAVLATMYIPSTESAYDSLEYITETATFGRLLRGMHYFGASAMVVLIGAHMARVFLTGSFKFPREVNWLSGVVLLALTLGMAFTGMLLRWDQDAIGSVLIAAEQAGRVPLIGESIARFILAGRTISGTTLSRFFAVHVFLLPGLIVAVVGLHLFLLYRNGVSEPPRAGRPVDRRRYRDWYWRLVRERGRPYWPDAAWREGAFALLVVLAIAALALAFGPRALSEPPDPTLTEVTPKPDWYFVWYQAYLEVLPSALGNWAILLTPLLAGAVLVALPFVAGRGERSPARRPWAVGVVVLTTIVVAVFLITGLRAPYVPDFETEPLSVEAIGAASGPAYDGAQLFYGKGCQYCHAVEGRGGRYGPDLTHVARRLPPEQLTVIILRGRENMPAYRGSLTDEELAALLAFLRAIDER